MNLKYNWDGKRDSGDGFLYISLYIRLKEWFEEKLVKKQSSFENRL